MMTTRAARAGIFALVIWLANAGPVWACPSCIGKNESLPPSLKLVGLFLLIPFLLFGIFVVVVRRLGDRT